MTEQKQSLVLVSDASEFGGAEVYLKLLASQLPQEYRVQLVARAEFESKFAVEGANYTFVPLPGSFLGWYRFCREFRDSVFHFNLSHYGACRLHAFIAYLAGARKIYGTLHTLINESRLQHWFPKSVVARLFFRTFVRVICPSQYVATTLIQQRSVSQDRVVVIHNGIPEQEVQAIPRQSLSVPESSFLIVGVGRMHIEKGFDYLIRAVAMLPSQAHLVLVGDGEYLEQFKTLAKELQIESRVTFTGYRQDSMSIVKAADVLVLPSYFENFPYVILEAMMLGVPVVASNVGGIPEQLNNGKAGLLVEARNAQSIVDSLEKLINDPRFSETLSTHAQQYYRNNFTLNRSATMTMSMYRLK